MSELFARGRVIDLVLCILALEVVALQAWRHGRGRGLHPLDMVGQLLSGALLLLALRCVLTGADYRITWALVTASFPAHLYDLWRRIGALSPRER